MKVFTTAIWFSFIFIFFIQANCFALNNNANDVNNNTTPSEITKPTDSTESKPEVQYPHPSRGQLLYENHCVSCHESQMHIRANTKVDSLSKLHYFVLIRSSESKLKWNEEDRKAVIDYLNNRFYKFSNDNSHY